MTLAAFVFSWHLMGLPHLSALAENIAGNVTTVIQPHKQDALNFQSFWKHLIGEKKFEQAIDEFSKAVELDPVLADAYFRHGFVYSVWMGEDYKAAGDWKKAEKLDSDGEVRRSARDHLKQLKGSGKRR